MSFVWLTCTWFNSSISQTRYIKLTVRIKAKNTLLCKTNCESSISIFFFFALLRWFFVPLLFIRRCLLSHMFVEYLFQMNSASHTKVRHIHSLLTKNNILDTLQIICHKTLYSLYHFAWGLSVWFSHGEYWISYLSWYIYRRCISVCVCLWSKIQCNQVKYSHTLCLFHFYSAKYSTLGAFLLVIFFVSFFVVSSQGK